MNPLDDMTWEERFWVAYKSVLELQKQLAVKNMRVQQGTKWRINPLILEQAIANYHGRVYNKLKIYNIRKRKGTGGEGKGVAQVP